MTAGPRDGPGPVSATGLLDVAVAVAEEAGRLLRTFATRHRAGDDLDVATKTSDTDPVSEADRAAERLIADRLAALRPDDGLLGEEDQASRAGTTGLRWVVDPLDGTVNFLYGYPQWAVSVACEDDRGVVVGVVHDPSRDETFLASRGGGARLGDAPLHVTDPDDLGHVLVATGFAYDAAVRADQARDAAVLLRHVRDVRRGGSAALDLAWCAAGRVDAYLEFGLSPWDWAAGRLLVAEAGGIVSEHRRRLGRRTLTGLVAGGRHAHDALTGWLATSTEHDDQPRSGGT